MTTRRCTQLPLPGIAGGSAGPGRGKLPSGAPEAVELPPHRVRVSPKAKKVRLTVSVRKGLEVVIPRRFPQRRVPEILREHHAWIEETMRKVAAERRERDARGEGRLPAAIALRATGEAWPVIYLPSPGRCVRVAEEGGRLVVSGPVHSRPTCLSALREWLAGKAKERLLPWLSRIASEQGLSFTGATVRGARTRWGSCSQRGSISVNRKLLFLPPHLVRYVFLHELCHTAHLNHSARFWAFFRAREPQAEALAAELRKAGRFVPGWAGGME